jgi:hypothetical protein
MPNFPGTGTGPDYARILSTLNNSKEITKKDGAYQAIKQLIEGQKKFQQLILDMFAGTTFGDELAIIINMLGSGIELTGDVTGGPSASPVATTIANDAVTTAKIINDAVTYAKMQNVSAASRLLGRGSAAGSGNVEEITLDGTLALTGTVLGVISAAVSVDHVVLSDGNNPPAPVDDGAGNFVYVAYTP